MSVDYSQHIVSPKSGTATNNNGGEAFVVDRWKRLERWLILGSEGGTFYATEKKLTIENVALIKECLDADPMRTVDEIVRVSHRGLAPKNDQAIFALALAASHSHPLARRFALRALPEVCRIGTHLFQFANAVDRLRGWGRGLKSAVGRWYTGKTPESLAYDMVKYRQREGWSHRDLLRLSHPAPQTPEQHALFRYATGHDALETRALEHAGKTRSYGAVALPSAFIAAFEQVQKTDDVAVVLRAILDHGLTHEMIPGQWKNDASVWEALLIKMPMTAMVRNLGKMSSLGLFKPFGAASMIVTSRLDDAAFVKKARLHPMNLLIATKTYASGKGDKGSNTWEVSRAVTDALESAFYHSFDAIEPSNKNQVLALDVSGSMGSPISGMPISCREATAVLAMVTARVEKSWAGVCFSHTLQALPDITPTMRLADVIRVISNIPFGGTNCSLPMLWSMQNKIKEVDAFQIYTDCETMYSQMTPATALRMYRQFSGRPTKLVVNAMTSNGFTLADPNDAGMLDVVGMSPDVPSIVANFIRG